MTVSAFWEEVRHAVRSVDDPEYPGISIVDLGLVESIEANPGTGEVTIGLVPTFSGCPALAMIADDVERAVSTVDGVTRVKVDWLLAPVWSIHRVSDAARNVMADRFTVAVQIGNEAPACPRCGTPTEEQSLFGPSRCRSIHHCPHCSETVEVMRGSTELSTG